MNSKEQLIRELKKAGIKHKPENIIRITRRSDNKIIFLEVGNESAGLRHIVNNHKSEFRKCGVTESEIPDLLILAIVEGQIIGYQSTDRPIYELRFKGRIQRVAVTIGDNGYIVCANPRSPRII